MSLGQTVPSRRPPSLISAGVAAGAPDKTGTVGTRAKAGAIVPVRPSKAKAKAKEWVVAVAGFLDLVEVEALARRAHAGQVDQAGVDYVSGHVASVAALVAASGGGVVAQQSAWLHDVVEDTSWSLGDLLAARVDPAVVEAVDVLTHRPHEPRVAYYARVRAHPVALQVKLADVADNADPSRLARLDPETAQRLTRKYAAALDALTSSP